MTGKYKKKKWTCWSCKICLRTQGKVRKDSAKYVMEGAVTLLTVSLYPCPSCFYPEVSSAFMGWSPQGLSLGMENLMRQAQRQGLQQQWPAARVSDDFLQTEAYLDGAWAKHLFPKLPVQSCSAQHQPASSFSPGSTDCQGPGLTRAPSDDFFYYTHTYIILCWLQIPAQRLHDRIVCKVSTNKWHFL